jgi:hypothetical protein
MNQQCPLEICDGTHAYLHIQMKSIIGFHTFKIQA